MKSIVKSKAISHSRRMKGKMRAGWARCDIDMCPKSPITSNKNQEFQLQ